MDNSKTVNTSENNVVVPLQKKKRVHIMTPKRVVAFAKAQEARRLKLEQRRKEREVLAVSDNVTTIPPVKTIRRRRIPTTTTTTTEESTPQVAESAPPLCLPTVR